MGVIQIGITTACDVTIEDKGSTMTTLGFQLIAAAQQNTKKSCR